MILIQRWPLTSRSMGFLIWLCVRAAAFLSFDLVIPYLAHKCIAVGWCVAWIHDLVLKPHYQHFIFTMNVSEQDALWHGHTKLDTWLQPAYIHMGKGGIGPQWVLLCCFSSLDFFYIYFVFSEGFEIQTYTRHLSTVFKQWGFFCVPHEVTMTRDIHLQGHLWWPVAFTPAASHLAGELFDIRNIQILKKKPIIANFIHYILTTVQLSKPMTHQKWLKNCWYPKILHYQSFTINHIFANSVLHCSTETLGQMNCLWRGFELNLVLKFAGSSLITIM